MNRLDGLIADLDICLRCIGRTVGEKGSMELNSSVQGARALGPDIISSAVDEDSCQLCGGLVAQSIKYTEELIGEIQQIEFDTFLVGCSLEDYDHADLLLENYGFSPISLKFEIRKEMGLRIVKALDKQVDFSYPDLTIVYDANKQEHQIDIRALYILGRYRKLVRGIPQTKWPCSNCKGRGCDECGHTGQQYPTSVELEISTPFIEASKAEDSSFHGAGREDIDALMLGSGRPFVLELKYPKLRSLDLKQLVTVVNQSGKVEISNLRFCEKDVIAYLKQGSANAWKRYQARVVLDTPVDQDQVLDLQEWGRSSHTLEQRTPNRVSHRRTNKIRRKEIYSVEVEQLSPTTLTLNIHAQGGAYIKEFISSDEGRTNPSVSQILGTGAICTALDVLEVDARDLFDDNP